VLARLALAEVDGLLPLLDECPHLAGDLAGQLGVQAPSPGGGIEFIASAQQLRSVRALLHAGNK
jgi:hypothetical protein